MHDQQVQDATITSLDEHLLRQFLIGAAAGSLDQEHLESLEERLETARIVDPASIPADIVTIDSCVRIQDLSTEEESSYTLVMPHKANMSRGAIAITAPLGRAMLGRKRGDILQFKTPGGLRRVRVVEILYQPEADRAQRRQFARISKARQR